jgi:hypothetical protein
MMSNSKNECDEGNLSLPTTFVPLQCTHFRSFGTENWSLGKKDDSDLLPGMAELGSPIPFLGKLESDDRPSYERHAHVRNFVLAKPFRCREREKKFKYIN